MTLSPVFRSRQAVELLAQHGIWERFAPSLQQQVEASGWIYAEFEQVIGAPYRMDPTEFMRRPDHEGDDEQMAFLQDYFFLTLFLALFESLGIDPARLPFYARLNYCIMGTITAADNLFDDQAKNLLPLRPVAGARYQSILQLMCFERLMRAVGDIAAGEGLIDAQRFAAAQRGLLDQMAEIGLLEGSEEGGVSEIPTPEAMIDRVHRVRGGKLFGLAFVAPAALETGEVAAKLERAEPAVARLGTAFQIVDDLTDFEFDLGRRSHNLVVSQIHHKGSDEERAALARLWEGAEPEPGMVEGIFAESARAVLATAREEAREAFRTLEALGFWFPARHADDVVQAIVGLEGVARMASLTEPGDG